MKVLYIDGDGPFGGPARSLFEVLSAMPSKAVEPYFVAARGTSLHFYRQIAKDIVATGALTRFDNTWYSYYRGLRWFVLLREIFHLPFTIAVLVRARLRWKQVDLIHLNEVTHIIPGLIAKRLFGVPMVIHVRSLARVEDRSLRCRWLNARLRNDAAAIIAIDEGVRTTLPSDAHVDVIHNAFTPKPSTMPDEPILKKLNALRPRSLKIGFVGNLHHAKGLFDLLDAAKLVKQEGRDVEFIIVGGSTRANGLKAWLLDKSGLAPEVHSKLASRVAREGLSDMFHLFGETFDIQRVYERIDVICFPSHLNAPGRPVFEAAFSSVPAIVAVHNPLPDTFIDGETGLAIPARDPRKLCEAILYFADQRTEIARMGANAKKLAEKNFSAKANAQKLLAVYLKATAESSISQMRESH